MGGFKTAIIRVVNRTGQESLSTARDIRIGIAIRLGLNLCFFRGNEIHATVTVDSLRLPMSQDKSGSSSRLTIARTECQHWRSTEPQPHGHKWHRWN